jgi:hypothetical protein
MTKLRITAVLLIVSMSAFILAATAIGFGMSDGGGI